MTTSFCLWQTQSLLRCLPQSGCCPPAGISSKTNLVIAPVADTSEHRLWLRDFPSANWDMVAIYYGSNATTFACEECIHVEANRGPKWQVVYQFTQGEAFKKLYSKQYQQVGWAHFGSLWLLVIQQQGLAAGAEGGMCLSALLLLRSIRTYSGLFGRGQSRNSSQRTQPEAQLISSWPPHPLQVHVPACGAAPHTHPHVLPPSSTS